jgi:hypothetical protein
VLLLGETIHAKNHSQLVPARRGLVDDPDLWVEHRPGLPLAIAALLPSALLRSELRDAILRLRHAGDQWRRWDAAEYELGIAVSQRRRCSGHDRATA